MSKTTTVPEQEAVSVNVPAATTEQVAEVILTPEPVVEAAAAKAPARKTVAKKATPAKRVAKPVAKAAQPAAAVDTKKAAKSDELVASAKPVKESKTRKAAPKKAKPVRDSFTFPADDYALLAELKQRALKAGHEIKKSELLRAGLLTLAAMNEQDLVTAMAGVERIKTGRPSK